jgi:3D (Asp-Asp-Asp) domain-containing protein
VAPAGTALAARERDALLELYSLESRHARAAQHLDRLEDRAETTRRERARAQRLASIAEAVHARAQERLAARLRALYVEGGPDPLAVLLGAETLDDAVSALDGLERLAEADRGIVREAHAARSTHERAARFLAQREAEVGRLATKAAAAQAALTAAIADQRIYVEELSRRRRATEPELIALTDRAQEAEARSQVLAGPQASAAAPAARTAPAQPVAAPGAQLTVVATAYALPGTTAIGLPVGPGVVAVDPSVIPLGTRMLIPGYGEGIAADIGGAIVGNRIDVWVPTEAEAVDWGFRTLVITVL